MTKILLVEDDKSLREIYGVRLLAEGYDIISAGDGEEALALAIKDRPALILSDVMMPKISGFDMLDILRSTTEAKDIKVIMMTALSSEDQRKRGEQLGADKYLVKSQVGIEDVVRAVHEVLGDAPTLASATTDFGGPIGASTAPSAPSTPAVQPAPTPTAPAPLPSSSPTPSSVPPRPTPATPAQSGLPQPTAPFSTPRPASNSSSNRVIEPIVTPPSQEAPLADRIAQELSGEENATNTPAPATEPSQPPIANPVASPPSVAPTVSLPPAPTPPAPSGIAYEETPLPPASQPTTTTPPVAPPPSQPPSATPPQNPVV